MLSRVVSILIAGALDLTNEGGSAQRPPTFIVCKEIFKGDYGTPFGVQNVYVIDDTGGTFAIYIKSNNQFRQVDNCQITADTVQCGSDDWEELGPHLTLSRHDGEISERIQGSRGGARLNGQCEVTTDPRLAKNKI